MSHVKVAAEVSGEALSFDVYSCTMLGDETDVLKHLIYAGRAARFGLSPSKLIPDEI